MVQESLVWVSVTLLGVVILALALQTWSSWKVVEALQEYLKQVQDPAIVVLAEVSQVESRLKDRIEAVENLVVERLHRSNELADQAARHFRQARSTEERTRRHADRAEEAEFVDGEGAMAPWDVVVAEDEAISEAVVAPDAPSLEAWAFNRRRS